VLYNALLCTLNPGDEVVIPAPCWVSYADIVLVGGGKPVFANCRQDDGYRLRPEVLDKAITTRQVVCIQRAVQPDRRRLFQGAAEGPHDVLMMPKNRHVWVLTDDMYEHLLYDDNVLHAGASGARFVRAHPHDERLSKTYCMTGGAWATAPAPSR